jgi:hypothetical protein
MKEMGRKKFESVLGWSMNNTRCLITLKPHPP